MELAVASFKENAKATDPRWTMPTFSFDLFVATSIVATHLKLAKEQNEIGQTHR